MGALYGTPGALKLLQKAQVDGRELLDRHCRGDWGDCCEEDAESNDQAVELGGRLLSVYTLPSALPHGQEVLEREVPRILVITEGDRSTTTLLLPEEY